MEPHDDDDRDVLNYDPDNHDDHHEGTKLTHWKNLIWIRFDELVIYMVST